MGKAELPARLCAEFIGTFLLILTVGCNVLGKTGVFGGVSIACVLMVAIYCFGGISGGNFNPAVSFCFGLLQSMGCEGVKGGVPQDWKEVFMYMAVQVAGGLTAGGVYAALFWDSFNLAPAKGFGLVSAGLAEMLYTFMLCFVVLNVAIVTKCEDKKNNHFYGLAIGFVIVAGAYGAGAISGGCFNPAVAIGIDTASAGKGFGWCAAYTAFELVGAALACILYRVIRPEEFGGEATPVPSAFIAEFLGTFILVLTVGLNVLGKSPAGAFSIAASLMCMIYALGDVSGANFNPAVTTAIACSGRKPEFNASKVVQYFAAQILGGIVAGGTYTAMYHGKGEGFGLGPAKGKPDWFAITVAELVFTFVLCYVVLSVAISTTTKSSQFYGWIIGSCVTVGGVAIGGISGGSLNPAVSIGVESADLAHGGVFYMAIVYALIELVGGMAAAGLFKITHASDEPEGEKLLGKQ